MSSVASSADPRLRARRPHTRTVTVPWFGAGAWMSLSVALVIVLSAVVARGGVRLEPTTDVEIGLMLAGAGAVIAACVVRRPATPLYGAWAVLAFALLAVFTALSIIWSLAPADSWLEANRTFAYLATLAGGVALARLFPERWADLLYGVLIGTVAVCAWALLTKVFPGAFAADEVYARLRLPFEYWNSVGLMSAIAVPALLWLAARRSGSEVVNAFAWPLLGLVIVSMMLSYSRGSLAALGLGLAVWFAAVPLRLRAVAALIASAVLATPVVIWAFAQDGLTMDHAPMAARADAGHELGTLLLLLTTVLLLAGLAVGFFTATRPPSEERRQQVGRYLLGGLALVPVVILLALSAAPGGISGQTSDAWTKLTDPHAATPANTPDRLTATSSVRARYWREAIKIHANSELVGTGAGSFATIRTRYRQDGDITVRHAHGYVVQTLSDLGWVGLGISLLAVFAWLWAAARALGARPRDRGLKFDAERVGLWTMAVIALIFGLHSAIDWTWFVPGNVVPALLCAGWVVGRGPLRARLAEEAAHTHSWPASTLAAAHAAVSADTPTDAPTGSWPVFGRPERKETPETAPTATAIAPTAEQRAATPPGGWPARPAAEQRHATGTHFVLPPPPRTRAERLRAAAPPPLRLAVALLVAALALFACWTAYQPVRSVHAGDKALDRLDQGAYEPAAAIAQIAVNRNPLSVDALFDLAAIQQARGQTPEALDALEKAVNVEPASAEAWRRLGHLRLDVLSQPRKAMQDFQAAYYLDPQNKQSWSDLLQAEQAIKADGG
jgi:hypothetical protein